MLPSGVLLILITCPLRFVTLDSVGLQVDVKKSEFIVQEIKFLGVIIRVDSLRIDPEKIAAIIN